MASRKWENAPEGFYSFGSPDGSGSLYDRFGLGGTGKTVLVIDEATPELNRLMKRFPKTFRSAILSLSWHLRGEMKTAMRSGKVPGTRWQELSDMHRMRRLDWARSGAYGRNYEKLKLKKRLLGVNVYGRENMMNRWKGGSGARGETAMGGRLINAIRYRRTKDLSVEIGAVAKSPAMYLAAVQGGQRGEVGSFVYRGTQKITPKMRRMFWAAGIPLSDKQVIRQPKRPLVYPVFRAEQPYMREYIMQKMHQLLTRGKT